MNQVLHITSGDNAGKQLDQAGLPGDVFVWHDMLYDGRCNAGWPTEETLQDRATFLKKTTGGGLSKATAGGTRPMLGFINKASPVPRQPGALNYTISSGKGN